LLSAVQSQADPEQPPDDVLVQIPGDPVPIGGHLQFECAARLSARCTANAPDRRRWDTNSKSSSPKAGEPGVHTASSTPDTEAFDAQLLDTAASQSRTIRAAPINREPAAAP
jgi:hypothetical protein